VTRKLTAALACRAGGSRLFGKPLQNLDVTLRITVIEYMIDFVRSETTIDDVVLGVSEGVENEIFHEIALRHNVASIRGDQTDVLHRLILCGEASEASDVFRITTESPFIYYEAIPDAWRRHVENRNDVTSIAGLPDGSGFEIISMATLNRCHREGDSRHRSELCTLYVRENQSEFKVEVLEAAQDVARDDLRLTIDYPEDLVLCRAVYEALKDEAPRIPLVKIVSFLDRNPHYKELVAPFVQGGRWYA
jgi:spore coat polysaccharide biosynthesis protein SpsF